MKAALQKRPSGVNVPADPAREATPLWPPAPPAERHPNDTRVELVCSYPGCLRNGTPFLRKRSKHLAAVSAGQTRQYCGHPCRAADPAHRAIQSTSHDDLAKPLKAILLSRIGPCGSPACEDADCSVPKGKCHRPGCTEDAVIAKATETRKRHVRGYPKPYCGFKCRSLDALTVRNAVARGLAEIEAYQEKHAVWTRSNAARYLKVNQSMMAYFENDGFLMPAERRYDIPGRGNGVVFYDINAVKGARKVLLELWKDENRGPSAAVYERMSPYWKNVWDGRRASGTAAKKRKAVGMPAHKDQSRIKVDDEKRQRIARLRSEIGPDGKPKHSLRAISAIVGVSLGSVEHALKKVS